MSQYPVAQVVGGQQGGVVGVVSQPSDVNLDIGGRVERMQNELDVPEQIVRDLLSVAGADIVVIADDSGSMGAVANYVTRSTRWTELRDTLQKLAHMLLVVDHTDGFHIQFLNDPTWHEIRSGSQVETLFYGRQPKGRTPLATRLRPLLSGQWHPKGHGAETDLILLIMTDGEPSDCSFSELRQLVGQKSPKVYCTFMMCTEEDDVVEQYNKSLDRLPGVDITDDYVSEKKEVEKLGNKLSYYKWMAKAVLGGKMPKYDHMDEKRAGGGGACCVIA
ncbi:unnamed protein product [Pelagomonas calceolata]|uniref:VWFA domain-containing protein n=1 Tax=Pelagomonas calceolata TaxID=35677 RepID=A0A8J2X018_9STRA|nr:unnamed protein product [Pelagomonas calceolata]|mmetsp:Transcript_13321/g.38586  ORF Transcript_13321/g.38586 Transcript_13321/m.38586 type:complete len:276 (+) Transcript_13321:239-1066(+)